MHDHSLPFWKVTPHQVRFVSLTVVILCLKLWAAETSFAQSPGEIEINLVEAKTDVPLVCRVQLRSAGGKNVKPRTLDTVGPWQLVDRKLAFRGKPGDYDYEIYHGPEFGPARGRFTLDKKSEAVDTIELPRYANLASEGWLGGDMLSYLPTDRGTRWLKAEELFWVASVLDPSNEKTPEPVAENSKNSHSSFLDHRLGSGVLIHHANSVLMPESSEDPAATLGFTPSSKLIVAAKKHQNENPDFPVHVEIQKLWARDLPIWLASGRVDSVQLLSDHLTIDGKGAAEVKPLVVPEGKFQGGRAAGRMVEQIYWQMLQAGFRIPLTAGSGFGKSSSPMGYNRVYALVGSKRADNWWQALRAGNSFVTNGPLLRVDINGMPPGHVFQANEPIELEIGATVTVADPVEYLEVIHNGQSLYRAALDEFAKQGGRIPPLKIDRSGWLVVRVITGRDFTYRMATTSPYYFEINGKQRVQAKAVEYFQSWLKLAREEIAKLSVEEQKLHEPYLSSAEKFWQARLEQATE